MSTSGAAASSTGQAGARGISEELIAGLVATHHSHADLLKSLGVDACALYKAKQKEVSVIDVMSYQSSYSANSATKSLHKLAT